MLTGEGSLLLWVFLQEIYIFGAWHEALLMCHEVPIFTT
jgi:hypothetical protein